MISHFQTKFTVFLVLAFCSFVTAQEQGPPPKYFNERFVIKSMAQIGAAQATYRALFERYGSLADLRSAGFIDGALTSGAKYGYRFEVTAAANTFTATATPLRYKKTGLRSYHLDQLGVVKAADIGGKTGDENLPYVDTCALWGIGDNERCVISALRTLHSAQMTYAATVGAGAYAHALSDLYAAGLIDIVLGHGSKHGYAFTMETESGPNPRLCIRAQPANYNQTGIRSFFVDEKGVIRGADRQGGPAGPLDPPILD
jgi:hypothetical protein